MILGLSFSKDTPRVELPDMPRGIEVGVTVRFAVRRTGSDPRQRILELGTDAGARLFLETGDRPDTLILGQVQDGRRKEIVAAGVLPSERWIHITARVASDGDAQIELFGRLVTRGNIGRPNGPGRTQNSLGSGSEGVPFVGELSQLEIWRGPTPELLASGGPKLDSDQLWAAYPLDRTTPYNETRNGTTVTRHRIQDDGKLGKHGSCREALAGVQWDEPLTDRQGRAIQFVDAAQPARLAPLAALADGLTLEAWVCPSETTQLRSVLRVRGAAPIGLCVGGPNGSVRLHGFLSSRIDRSPEEVTLLSLDGAIKAGCFVHIAATVQQISAKKFSAALYVQGQLVAQNGWDLTATFKPELALLSLFRADHLALSVGGPSPIGSVPGFLGSVAEVRVWSKARLPSEIGSSWLVRVRGDEPGLLACYRFDEINTGCTRDISPVRGVGVLPPGVALKTVGDLPLLPSQSSERVRIVARGKLLEEVLLVRVPEPGIVHITGPNSNPLPTGNTGPGGLPTAAKYQHARTLVFDATLQPKTPRGDSLHGATLEVRIDEPLTAITSRKDDSAFNLWQAGQTYRVTVPASGTLRLRFRATGLACPTLRVRIAGQQADLWTIVRPDEKTHRQLRTLEAADLQKPVDGRRSPLPAGSTAEDATALAEVFHTAGRVLPPFPQSRTPILSTLPTARRNTQFKSFVSDGWNALENAAEDTGDTLQDAGQTVVDGLSDGLGAVTSVGSSIVDSAGRVVARVENGVLALTDEGAKHAERLPKTARQLLAKAGPALDTLVGNAKKLGARVGTETITTFVRSADSLAIATESTASDVVHAFELVGTTIVKGTRTYFRIAVRSIQDALAVVEAFCERIGAFVEEVLSYLAYLFRWDDFLQASDEAVRFLEGKLDMMPTFLRSIEPYKTKLVGYLNTTLDSSVLNKSIAQLCGIRIDPDVPVIEELDYVIEQVQRIQEYAESLFMRTAATLGGSLASGGLSANTLNRQLQTSEGLLPCAALSNPTAALTTTLNDLLKNAAGLSNSSGSILDALFDSVLGNVEATIETGTEAMRKRIELPAVTDFIERVLLGGRSFTALRIVALCAAIPNVLSVKLSQSARSGSLSPQANARLHATTSSLTRSTDATSSAKRSPTSEPRASDWEIWLPWSCSLVGSVFLLIDTLREFGEREGAAKSAGGSFFQMICGFFTICKGLLQVRLVKLLPAGAQPHATASCLFEAGSGAWMLLSPILRENDLFKKNPALLNKLDVAIYGLLGLGQVVTLIIPLANGSLNNADAITATCLRGAAYLSNMSTRGLSSADNGDATGKRKKVTIAFLAVSTALDLADASYGQSIDATKR